MNLQDFLDYKKNCPICNSNLTTFFHSQKKQNIKYEEDRIVVIFQLNALQKHHINYKVGYSFSPKDNSWQVEFYNQDNIRFEKDSPDFLRTRFKELNNNLGEHKFYKHCTNPYCCRYNYSTNYFKLNFKTGFIDDLNVSLEYVGMSAPTEDGYKVYKLLNDYRTGKSMLVFGKHQDEMITRSDWGMHGNLIPTDRLGLLETPIIKFSSKEETMDRIMKLITFS